MTKNDTRSRSWRRHHDARMLQKALRIIQIEQRYAVWLTPAEIRQRAATIKDNLASCSCTMCGNPRRWLGNGEVTINEKRYSLRSEYLACDE
jgi:hypothetical protein